MWCRCPICAWLFDFTVGMSESWRSIVIFHKITADQRNSNILIVIPNIRLQGNWYLKHDLDK